MEKYLPSSRWTDLSRAYFLSSIRKYRWKNGEYGRIYDNDKVNIVCPWHGLEFDIRTGKHPGNPSIGLDPVSVQVDGEAVYILMEEKT